MKKKKADLDRLLDNAKETALLIWYNSKHTDSKQKVIQYYRKEKKRLQIEIWWLMWERDGLQMVVERLHKEIEEQDKEIVESAKDYVVLFRKSAIISILLLLSLVVNFILILD